jgi:hypothetical protein
MTIQVEISPETEAWLAAEAALKRMDVSAYAASLLEQAKRPLNPASHNLNGASKSQRADGQKSLAQLFSESPFRGLDLDFEADRDFGRDASL